MTPTETLTKEMSVPSGVRENPETGVWYVVDQDDRIYCTPHTSEQDAQECLEYLRVA